MTNRRPLPALLALILSAGCAAAPVPGEDAAPPRIEGADLTSDAPGTAPTMDAVADPPLPEIAADAPLDDRALRARFIERAGMLADDGGATDAATLREQLGLRTECQVDLTPPRQEGLSTAELFALRRPSALLFGNVYDCGRCSRWHAGLASGFAIGPDVVVTNHHVLENEKAAVFAAMTAAGDVYPVLEVLAADAADDAAIVRVGVPEGVAPLVPVPLAGHAPVGARVAVISNPTEQFFTFTEGMVSRYAVFRARRDGPASVRMAITAEYAKGSSGAPVLDAYGNVCGMVSATSSIYYDRDDDGRARNLQMVLRRCVPSAKILRLIRSAPATDAP